MIWVHAELTDIQDLAGRSMEICTDGENRRQDLVDLAGITNLPSMFIPFAYILRTGFWGWLP